MKNNFKKLQLEELGRISVDEFKTTQKIPLVIVLDNVRSANNVGSVFRTSDAFLVEKILLCGITCKPPHKDIQKTALGAQNSVTWEAHDNTLLAIQELKSNGYTVISIEQVTSSTMLQDYVINPNKKYALVMGNEVSGVDDDVVNASDACIEIPQFGTKHSFNVSVTTGMVVWEFAKTILLK